MWQLDFPWLLLLAPLPLLTYRALPAYRERRITVRVPFFAGISQALGQRPQEPALRRNGLQTWLNSCVWLLLMVACSRPAWLEKPIERSQPARDMVLALDLSQSMETRDFIDANGQRSDRLSAVKEVVRTFIAKRSQDRLGLIVFGSNAFAQSPLTLDHNSLAVLLDELEIGMAGPNTAIGDAIGLGVRMLDRADEASKLIILLSDGNDTASRLAPRQAAEIARRHGVIVHTIALGDAQANGDNRVDLESLHAIALASAGLSWRAEDRLALAAAYDSLDRITPRQARMLSHQPRRELFWVPLGAALAMLGLFHLGGALAAWRSRDIEAAS